MRDITWNSIYHVTTESIFTSTYFSGGMLLFLAGLIPLSSAFLE